MMSSHTHVNLGDVDGDRGDLRGSQRQREGQARRRDPRGSPAGRDPGRAAVARAFEAGPEGLEFIAFGPHHPGDGEAVDDRWVS